MKKVLNVLGQVLGRLSQFVGQFSDVAANALSALVEIVGKINEQIAETE